ncbi:hypothetical protein [Pseudodesulfovibrio pelocollis]|uniref:DUF7831 domain-containing protein n=1 Tax=Pseudodesulfovibrio pelocollis TaxID=3051432 RepID=UPI00255AD8BA|nr:hypothetical protein [Pseudodesulfovibrio sp. SB368]
MLITAQYLRDHPDHVFVFGDNAVRRGKGGAAALRDEPNTFGFITKKLPMRHDEAFYRPQEYQTVFQGEKMRLEAEIRKNPGKTYLVSKVGSGLASRFGIWEEVIRDGLKSLKGYPNVAFLYA